MKITTKAYRNSQIRTPKPKTMEADIIEITTGDRIFEITGVRPGIISVRILTEDRAPVTTTWLPKAAD